jgi:hypothetical protein
MSFDAQSLFTNVPVEEVLVAIKNQLQEETLVERPGLHVGAIMEMLEICLRISNFQFGDKYFQQKEGMAMGSSLSPVVSNIYMEFFETLSLHGWDMKPSLWLRCVDDTFIIWKHGVKYLQSLLDYLSSLRKSIKFSMEVESNGSLLFLNVFVTKKGDILHSAVYRKPTHTGRYLHFDSNHPVHVKRGVVESLVNRANVLCQNEQDLKAEMYTVRKGLLSNASLSLWSL